MFFGVYICLFVSVHNYSKSNEQIFIYLGPGLRKNWLNFGKDPGHILDTKKILNFQNFPLVEVCVLWVISSFCNFFLHDKIYAFTMAICKLLKVYASKKNKVP